MGFRQEVKSLRVEQGWNQKELAKKIGKSYQTISKLETGCAVHPRSEVFDALCRALKVSSETRERWSAELRTAKQTSITETLSRQTIRLLVAKPALAVAVSDAICDPKNQNRSLLEDGVCKAIRIAEKLEETLPYEAWRAIIDNGKLER